MSQILWGAGSDEFEDSSKWNMVFAPVLLSRILKYRASRWASIVAGTIFTITLTLTLFVAVPATHYAFFTTIEIACTALMGWYAWMWPNPEGNPINAALAQGKSA